MSPSGSYDSLTPSSSLLPLPGRFFGPSLLGLLGGLCLSGGSLELPGGLYGLRLSSSYSSVLSLFGRSFGLSLLKLAGGLGLSGRSLGFSGGSYGLRLSSSVLSLFGRSFGLSLLCLAGGLLSAGGGVLFSRSSLSGCPNTSGRFCFTSGSGAYLSSSRALSGIGGSVDTDL